MANEAVALEADDVLVTRAGESDSSSYRAFFSFSQQNSVKERVIEQLHVWLREKGWDPSLDQTGYEQRLGSEIFVQHHDAREGRSLRLRLTEESPIGEWRTELTMFESRAGDGWLLITVTNSEGRFVDVPRIATYVLDVIDGFDGPAALPSDPVLVSSNGVEDLLEELCSEEREGLVFVAGTADDSDIFPAFRDRVTRLTRQVRGLARVVILDPHATAAVEGGLGPTHAVPAWTVRTFQSDVDPAIELDARRHRILGLSSLAQRPDGELTRLLGRAARAHASSRSLPEEVLRVSRLLARLETRAAVSALAGVEDASEPPVLEDPAETGGQQEADSRSTVQGFTPEPGAALHEEASAYLAQVELVRNLLGVEELDEQTLRDLAERARRGSQVEAAASRVTRQLEEAQARLYALEDEVAYYRDYAEEEEFERAVIEEDRARLADQVRWLQGRLSEARDFEAAYGEVPDSAYTKYPSNFEELLARVPELEPRGVIFCADRRRAVDLDEHDQLGKLVRAAWDALLVLCDYLQARQKGDFDAGLDGYLQHTPTGYRSLPPKKFAATETGRTMTAYGNERWFPVPVKVEPAGTALMKAHFKLGRVGMVSPRMYLLDRAATDGSVYVGYLGEHLTNTKTN